MKREWRESSVFLASTFGMTWLLWLGAYLNYAPGSVPLTMLGTAIPSAMGLIFTYSFGGKQKLKELVCSALRVKTPKIWWLYSVLLFPIILLCACVIFAVTGGTIPPAQFPIRFLPIAFFYIFACMGPLGEEFGWRGFLLKRFLFGWSVIKSGFLLGLIWSMWHLPLFLIPGTIQHEIAKMGVFIAVSGYFLYTACISLLMSVLYTRTDENLLLCMVFHTLCNLSLGVAPIILIRSGAAILLCTLILVTAIVFMSLAYREKKHNNR